MHISASNLLIASQQPASRGAGSAASPPRAQTGAERARFAPSSFADALGEAAPSVPSIPPAQTLGAATPSAGKPGSMLDIRV